MKSLFVAPIQWSSYLSNLSWIFTGSSWSWCCAVKQTKTHCGLRWWSKGSSFHDAGECFGNVCGRNGNVHNLSGLPLACLVFRHAHRAVHNNWRLMPFWHPVAQRCFILFTSLHMHTQGSMLAIIFTVTDAMQYRSLVNSASSGN